MYPQFDPLNPFDGIKPSFGPFAGILGNWFGILVALVWAVALVIAAVRLIIAVGEIAKARRTHQAEALEEAMSKLMWPIVGVIALVSLPLLWTIIISIQ